MDFIQAFHSIEGKTLGSRQAQFRKLLQQLKSINPDENLIKNIAEKLEPRTKLEEALKIDFFIEFRMFDQLIQQLKSEKLYIIKKVIKEKWLFQKSFETITVNMLFCELLPEMSYTTRKTIFSRLAVLFKNHELADEYLEKGVKIYGVNAVIDLLPCCTIDSIKEFVTNYGIKFNAKHLLSIIKRDITFFEFYIEKHYIDIDTKKECVNYIAKNDTELYMKLHEKIESVTMSSNASKVVLKKHSSNVLKDVDKFQSSFHNRTMIHFYKKDFEAFFLAHLPPRVEKFIYMQKLKHMLELLKKEERFPMLEKVFQKQYNESFADHLEKAEENMFEILPKDLLKRVVDLEETRYKRDWYYYLPIEQSIPIYKKKINLTSEIYTRTTFINRLVDTCAFNGKDQNALLEVMKYFINRHRNDDSSVRQSFLERIMEKFKLSELSQAHWEVIDELLKIRELKKERYEYLTMQILKQKMILLMKNKQPIVNEVKNYLAVQESYYAYVSTDDFKNNADYEKIFLETVLDNLNEKNERYLDHRIHLYELVYDFNVRNPDKAMDLSNMDLLIEKWNKREYTHTYFLKALLKDYKNVAKYNLYDIVYYYTFQRDVSYSALTNILKREPERFLTFSEKVEGIKNKDLNSFWKILSKYEHLELPQRYVKSVLKSVDSDNFDKYQFAILAYFASTSDYINNVQKFIPNHKEKIEDQKLLDRQVSSIKCIRFASNLSQTLEFIFKFTEGDFLIYSLPAIFCATFHIKEAFVQDIIKELLTKAVSVRKHAIHMATMCGADFKHNLLHSVGKNEKNPSVRKFILFASLKCFLRNPCDESLAVLKANCQLMDPEDEEAFEKFVESSKTHLPEKYRTKYFKIAWDVFDKASPLIQPKRYNLLNRITKEIIITLDDEFCINLIKEKLFNDKDQKIDHCLEFFTSKYVSSNVTEDIMSTKLNSLFKIAKDALDSVSDKKQSCIRYSIYTLIKWLCNESIEIKSSSLASLLFLKVQSLGALEDIYSESLLIEFTKNYLEVYEDDDHWALFTKSLLNTFGNMSHNNQYGLFPLLLSVVEDMFGILNVQTDKMEILEGLAANIDNSINALLLLSFIPKYYTKGNEEYEFYNSLLDKIGNSRDPVVRLRYKHAINTEFVIREKNA